MINLLKWLNNLTENVHYTQEEKETILRANGCYSGDAEKIAIMLDVCTFDMLKNLYKALRVIKKGKKN